MRSDAKWFDHTTHNPQHHYNPIALARRLRKLFAPCGFAQVFAKEMYQTERNVVDGLPISTSWHNLVQHVVAGCPRLPAGDRMATWHYQSANGPVALFVAYRNCPSQNESVIPAKYSPITKSSWRSSARWRKRSGRRSGFFLRI